MIGFYDADLVGSLPEMAKAETYIKPYLSKIFYSLQDSIPYLVDDPFYRQ